MLLMQARDNGVVLDEKQLLFIAGGPDNAVNEDVDEQPIQDLALNVDNVFQADDCDAFDFDVDEAPTAQTMCMANLASADPYVKDNTVLVVQSNVSFVPNDAYMMIVNEMHEPPALSVSANRQHKVVNASLTTELATYKEQVKLYERWSKFELTEREQKIEEQLRIVITDHNIKEENLKKELHSVKCNLPKQLTPEQIFWSNDLLKMKAEALKEQTTASRPIKALTVVYYVEGLGHNLFSVRQFCDFDPEVAFRNHSFEDMMKSSPICLLYKASKNKSWLWHRYLNHLNFGTINDLTRKDLGLPRLKFEKDHLCSACQLGKSKKHTHTPKTKNTNLEVLNTLHMDLCGLMRVQTINRKKYILVIVDDYSSEDLGKLQPTADIGIFVGYAPSRKIEADDQAIQTILLGLPEDIYAAVDSCEMAQEIWLRVQQMMKGASTINHHKIMEHFKGIQKALTKEIKKMKDAFEELKAKVAQNIVDKKHDEIERKNLLITNDNLIAECLYKEVFYVATNYELNVARFTEMHVANTIVKAHNMANENVPAPTPTRSDDQILPFVAWDTLMFEAKTGAYRLQLDEDWFRLDINLLREALEFTPVYQAHQFVSPPSGEEYDLDRAIQISLESFQVQGQAHVGGVAIQEPIAEATRPLLIVNGKGKAIATEEQAAQTLLALHTPKRRSTIYQFIFYRRTPATEEAFTRPSAQPQDDTSTNIVRETPFPVDAETGADTDKIDVLDEGHARSDPGKTPESRPSPDDNKMDEDQAGSDPKKSHDPLSSSGTLSSMKNLDDTYTFGDQFFNDKSTEDEPGKQNVDAKVLSMVTVLIHQASTSVPPLSIPIIDLSPPKLVASPLPEPFPAATTKTTTTTLPLLPPPQQQSTTDSKLVARVTTLEKKFADFEQKSQTLYNTTQNLGSRVFTLELWDLPHKINQTVNEVVKEAVHIALQASLRDRFRELPEDNMKEIIHQQMFESGSYKLLPEHVALYEAFKASMKRVNIDEFLAEKDKSRKRRRDDQDPPPPLPDLDLSKK
nr:hypothetical protein [Tanacetum cinerariifolium]